MNAKPIPKYVAYYRVSTAKQGKSGLGLDAQREAVKTYIGGSRLLGEYIEIESGKKDYRPKLQEALRHAEMTRATLVIAKLDRLSRNVGFIEQLQDSKVKFVACDMPDANETMVQMMAVLARWERKAISKRTTEALAAAKRKGVKLGNPNGARALKRAGKGNVAAIEKRKALADEHAAKTMVDVVTIQAAGARTLQQIADALNERGNETRRGGKWSATAVQRLLRR